MTQAIDFKRVHSKEYKIWRILQSPGAWLEVYKAREKRLRSLGSAIIFPEQLLGLNQRLVYCVNMSRDAKGVTSRITILRQFQPLGIHGETLDTMDAIRQYEAENSTAAQSHRICVGDKGRENSFYEQALFSGLKDAVKYQSKEQAKLLSQIG